MTNLFFDVLIAGLLVMAIIFCWRLSERIKTMRQMGAELSPFMKNMSNCLGQISQSIDTLKQVADLGNQGLNEHIPVAISLKDDFDLLLEYSEKMARHLDDVIEKAREVDQRLQQTLRIAEDTRSSEHRINPAFQKTAEHPQQSDASTQKSFAKDHFMEDQLNMGLPPLTAPKIRSKDDEIDYFVPSHLQNDLHQSNGRRESKLKQEQSIPGGRGIMTKLRGLR